MTWRYSGTATRVPSATRLKRCRQEANDPVDRASHATLTPSPYGGDGVSVQSSDAGRLARQSALRGIMHATTSAAGQGSESNSRTPPARCSRHALITAIMVGRTYRAARAANSPIQNAGLFASVVMAGRPRRADRRSVPAARHLPPAMRGGHARSLPVVPRTRPARRPRRRCPPLSDVSGPSWCLMISSAW